MARLKKRRSSKRKPFLTVIRYADGARETNRHRTWSSAIKFVESNLGSKYSEILGASVEKDD